MKFELTQSFRGDVERLSREERNLVRQKLPAFVAACERYAGDPSAKWPASLRVRDVEGAPGILEVTFSFSGPDIRATFEWADIDGELAVRWRRIGGAQGLRAPLGVGRERYGGTAMTADRIDAVRALLAQTEEAHGKFEATELNGVYDQEWPRWYAGYAVKHGIGDLLGRPVATDDLAHFLASSFADFEQAEPGASEPWADYTARRITAEL